MALRAATLKTSNSDFALGLRRWLHAVVQSVPMDSLVHSPPSSSSPSFILPDAQNDVGLGLPSSIPVGSMELMAVPKKKVSRHKRGIRNGPKALKPVPVIIRCKSCGRVKLPHFFCCSGYRENANEQN